MDFPEHDGSADEESPAPEFVDIHAQQSRTLAYRMIMFVYDRLAIDRDARTVAFWEEFRVLHGNVALSAYELRDFFYHDLMDAAEHLENLPHHVRLYLNPMFNRYRREVLRQQDRIGLCYDRQTRRHRVSCTSSKLPIELLLEAPSRCPKSAVPVPSDTSNESYRLPTTEQVLRFVSDNVSELLWTEEEKPTKVALSTSEWQKRLAVLTKNGISLAQCAEPEMKCSHRMRLLGLQPEGDGVTIQPAQDRGRLWACSSSDLEDFRTPIDYSTPVEPRSRMAFRKKRAPRTGTVPLADSGYDLSSFQGPTTNSTPRLPPLRAAWESGQRLSREERLRAMQNDGQQPCCSYRKPK